MSEGRFLHIHEQVAAHLRTQLQNGRWTETMPGRNQLVKMLEVSGKTVDLALHQLESEGLLQAQGAGRRRKITLPKGEVGHPAMRVCILCYERPDFGRKYEMELKFRLEDAGHEVSFAQKSLCEMGMKVDRVEQLVKTTSADAWIVCSGSKDILKWFSEQKIQVFALFGRREGLPIAGASPRKIPAMHQAVDEMVSQGHQRIVMMAREERRHPYPADYEQAFLDRLSHHGIEPGSYNLPDWMDSRAGFHECLKRLFKLTPPTAILVCEPQLFMATMQHIGKLGIHAPGQISLFVDDPEPAFLWCDPVISHTDWDSQPIMRRVVQWVRHIAQGREDIQQRSYSARFVRGGTIGPVR
ncbi:MAG: substrate-binding domain-containing protein [Akkermansiaceae bacterium]|nr:substrate-binding domain-containing protein [Akkermansiaceae bacterium]